MVSTWCTQNQIQRRYLKVIFLMLYVRSAKRFLRESIPRQVSAILCSPAHKNCPLETLTDTWTEKILFFRNSITLHYYKQATNFFWGLLWIADIEIIDLELKEFHL